MPNPVSVEVVQSVDGLHALESEWHSLLAASVWPTVYMRYDYTLAGIIAFAHPADQLLVFTFRDQSDGTLVGLLPLRVRKAKRYFLHFSIIEYAVTAETDKPYPLIRKNWEGLVWREFAAYAKTMVWKWDIFDLIEVRETSAAQAYLGEYFASERYLLRTSNYKQSPLIALDRDWSELWSKHQHMRKKMRLMRRDFGDTMRFTVFDSPDTWEQCLNAYIDLERRSWKYGKIGISKNERILGFYRKLFPTLAAAGLLKFGLLFVNDRLISGEIAYATDDRVYFSHGSYDDAYQRYSPGLVSKCLFIEYFHGKSYRYGDYLAGYADYMNNWASGTLVSHTISIFRSSFKNRLYLALIDFKRLVYAPIKNRFRAALSSSG